MILPFSTQFKDGTPTHFIAKIWECLLSFGNYSELYDSMYSVIDKVDRLDPQLFAENVVAKPHTIREDAHDRWHEGSLIHPVVFNRSKNQFQFAPTLVCKSVQEIEIVNSGTHLLVRVDGIVLYEKEPTGFLMDQKFKNLTANDGFDPSKRAVDFFAWFDHDFSGKIIHWTDLKY